MAPSLDEEVALKALERRIKTILPEEYQDGYEEVQPVSMGSAALKFGRDGKVAWGEIWETFCDLAMAGGPPHKGKLLEPGSAADIEAQPDRYKTVVKEICRGVSMVADLPARPAPTPGWIRAKCESPAMAEWLVRAIMVENVSAHCEGSAIDLPAGPAYRIEKEIKNVITVVAKTSHYWQGHMWRADQCEIADLFAEMAVETPLVQPIIPGNDIEQVCHRTLGAKMAETIHQMTGLESSNSQYPNWIGVECRDVRTAIWLMRAAVVSNIISRREDTILFVPVNPKIDPDGKAVVQGLIRVCGFAHARGIL
jgi:sirohydrochlorin cobaltochelatase